MEWKDLSNTDSLNLAHNSSPYDGDSTYNAVFEQLSRALFGKARRHALLASESGIGKSALLGEFVDRAATGRFPSLTKRRFVLADCRFVAPAESTRYVVDLLTAARAEGDVVLCVDGMASLFRPPFVEDNRRLLLAALAKSSVQIVGLLSDVECDDLLASGPELQEFFTRIDVPEPDVSLALRLVGHFSRGLEQEHQVTIESEAVCHAVHMTANYILNDRLPGKAVKVLQRACEDVEYNCLRSPEAERIVTAQHVFQAIAQRTGISAATLAGVGAQCDYSAGLRERIVGQDEAVETVARELGLIHAGFVDPHKPASVMLFIGMTGTGKTELAKALATLYSGSKRLNVYAMGNFVEQHSVSGLIGVPAGYVGHELGGRLVNELNADPYAVFLLDEVDKAHPDVLQPLLNLFDDGWIRDQKGTKAYGHRAVFVLTTNIGQRVIGEMWGDGKPMTEIRERLTKMLTQIRHTKANRPVFSPEFLARIKTTIVFKPLDEQAMIGIAQRHVRALKDGWRDRRQKFLHVPADLIEFIGRRSYDINRRHEGREGGRIVRKLVSEWIEAPLQAAISEAADEYRRNAWAVVQADVSRCKQAEMESCPFVQVTFSPVAPPGCDP